MPPKLELPSLPIVDLPGFRRITVVRHGLQDLEEIVPDDTQAVYADSTYMGKEREEALSKHNIKAHFVKHATRYKK